MKCKLNPIILSYLIYTNIFIDVFINHPCNVGKLAGKLALQEQI